MDNKVNPRLVARIENDLEAHGFTGMLSALPRMIPLIGRHFERKVALVEAARDTIKAERTAMSRKLSQRPQVVLWEDLSLAEVFEIMHLRNEGVGVSKIAALFDLPVADVRHVLRAAERKEVKKVVYDAEARRRRSAAVRPMLSGVRQIDVEDGEHGGEADVVQLVHGSR